MVIIVVVCANNNNYDQLLVNKAPTNQQTRNCPVDRACLLFPKDIEPVAANIHKLLLRDPAMAVALPSNVLGIAWLPLLLLCLSCNCHCCYCHCRRQ